MHVSVDNQLETDRVVGTTTNSNFSFYRKYLKKMTLLIVHKPGFDDMFTRRYCAKKLIAILMLEDVSHLLMSACKLMRST